MNKSMNLKRCILPLLLLITLLLPSAAYAAVSEIPDFDGAAAAGAASRSPSVTGFAAPADIFLLQAGGILVKDSKQIHCYGRGIDK